MVIMGVIVKTGNILINYGYTVGTRIGYIEEAGMWSNGHSLLDINKCSGGELKIALDNTEEEISVIKMCHPEIVRFIE